MTPTPGCSPFICPNLSLSCLVSESEGREAGSYDHIIYDELVLARPNRSLPDGKALIAPCRYLWFWNASITLFLYRPNTRENLSYSYSITPEVLLLQPSHNGTALQTSAND